MGTFWEVQQLRPHTSTTRDTDSTPDQGTKILHAVLHAPALKKKEKKKGIIKYQNNPEKEGELTFSDFKTYYKQN